MKKKIVSMTLAITLVLLLLPANATAKQKLNKSKASLYVGETLALNLSGAKGKVIWKSNKKSVATVSKDGVVTAKKKGSATITATNAGKKYSCKIKVAKLPKNYATINGKKVKVGKSTTLTYKIQSSKGICNIRIHMTYDKKALQITSEENDRFKTWLCNNSFPDYIDGNKTYDLYELVSVDPNKTEFIYKNVDCKKAKVADKFKVKALKSGNYKINTEYKCESISAENMKEVDFTLTVTAK